MYSVVLIYNRDVSMHSGYWISRYADTDIKYRYIDKDIGIKYRYIPVYKYNANRCEYMQYAYGMCIYVSSISVYLESPKAMTPP